MIRKPRLLTPGPTLAPPGVSEALVRAGAMHHRSAEFIELYQRVRLGLGSFMLGEPLAERVAPMLLSGAGTLALEAALVNLLSPGDAALFVVNGRFSARWAEMAEALGYRAERLVLDWGKSAAPDALGEALNAAAARGIEIRAVFLPGVETSTGALSDVAALASVVHQREGCLLAVDGITWIGAHEVQPASIGVDALSFASQKALGVPPGLSALWLSERAWERAGQTSTPRAYLGLRRERREQASGSGAFTAPIAQIVALDAALAWLDQLPAGARSLAANAGALAEGSRAALLALGFSILAESPAQSVTVALPPQGVPADALRASLIDQSGLRIAGGQEHLKGRAIRLSHLGYIDWVESLGVIAALERALAALSMAEESPIGRGVTAFQQAMLGAF